MWRKHFVVLQGRPCIFFRIGRAAMSEQTFGWRKLYEAAILEIVPDKLAIRIVAAEQALAQRESLGDSKELERHKLADTRSMLKTLGKNSMPAEQQTPSTLRDLLPENKQFTSRKSIRKKRR